MIFHYVWNTLHTRPALSRYEYLMVACQASAYYRVSGKLPSQHIARSRAVGRGGGGGRGRTAEGDAANRGATRGITQSSITLRIQNQLATGQRGHSGAGSWAGRSGHSRGRCRRQCGGIGLIKAGAVASFSLFLLFLPLCRNRIGNWIQTNVYLLWRVAGTNRFWNKCMRRNTRQDNDEYNMDLFSYWKISTRPTKNIPSLFHKYPLYHWP